MTDRRTARGRLAATVLLGLAAATLAGPARAAEPAPAGATAFGSAPDAADGTGVAQQLAVGQPLYWSVPAGTRVEAALRLPEVPPAGLPNIAPDRAPVFRIELFDADGNPLACGDGSRPSAPVTADSFAGADFSVLCGVPVGAGAVAKVSVVGAEAYVPGLRVDLAMGFGRAAGSGGSGSDSGPGSAGGSDKGKGGGSDGGSAGDGSSAESGAGSGSEKGGGGEGGSAEGSRSDGSGKDGGAGAEGSTGTGRGGGDQAADAGGGSGLMSGPAGLAVGGGAAALVLALGGYLLLKRRREAAAAAAPGYVTPSPDDPNQTPDSMALHRILPITGTPGPPPQDTPPKDWPKS